MSKCSVRSFISVMHCAPCREAYVNWAVVEWDSQAECSNRTASLYVCTYEGFPMMFSYKVYI